MVLYSCKHTVTVNKHSFTLTSYYVVQGGKQCFLVSALAAIGFLANKNFIHVTVYGYSIAAQQYERV